MDIFLLILFDLIVIAILLCIMTFFATCARNAGRSARCSKYFYESDSDLYAHKGMSKNLKTGKATSTRSPLYK